MYQLSTDEVVFRDGQLVYQDEERRLIMDFAVTSVTTSPEDSLVK